MKAIRKLILYYKRASNAVKATLWFALCTCIQKGIQFLTVPLFTRLLTTQQYGQFSLYQSWYSLLFIFATLNLSYGVFNNGMVKYPQDRWRYLSSMQGLSTAITATLLVGYLIFSEFWNKILNLPTIVVLAMFLEFLMAPALSFWSAKQRFEYKYRAMVGVTLTIAFLSPTISFLAVTASAQKGLVRILSFSLVNSCVGLLFYIYNACQGKKFYVKEYWLYAIRFNVPLIPHYLSMMVLSQADRIMIGKFYGTGEVAIYSVAYTISLAMNVVMSSINSTFIPWTYQKCAKKDFEKIKKLSNILLLGFALISYLPILFAPEVVSIMAPQEYQAAVWVIPPITASVYFTFLYSLFANIEFYYEENKFVMIASTLAALMNILLNAIFIPLCGYVAAGYTTLICYILLSIAHYIFVAKVYKKHADGKKVYDLKIIILLSSVYLVGTGGIMLLYHYPFIRYTALILGTFLLWHYRRPLLSGIKQFKR